MKKVIITTINNMEDENLEKWIANAIIFNVMTEEAAKELLKSGTTTVGDEDNVTTIEIISRVN